MKENKCAPNIDFNNDSCITLELLKNITLAYNDYNYDNKININLDSKEEDILKNALLKELRIKLGNNEEFWIKNKSLKTLSKKDTDLLENKIFRPVGPQGKFDWLSTLDINKVLYQYEQQYDDFKFLGAVPIDFMDLDYLIFNKINFKELQDKNLNKFGVIFNLDESWKNGSHWVSLYFDLIKGQIYFSDSFAIGPEQRIIDFINIIEKYLKYQKNINNIDKKYNKTRHQKGNSECGVYSINFILRLLKGKTFNYITRKRLNDDKVNKCRLVYFN